jgi:hypothetical protein
MPSDPAGAPLPAPRPSPELREHAVEALTRHFAADRLSMDDFERCVERVYAAPSAAALAAILGEAGISPQTGTGAAAALAPAGGAPSFGRVVARFRNNERGGAMLVPRRLEVRSVFGNVELDLQHATFAPGVTEIHVRAVFGNVEITLPAGVHVEERGEAIAGSFSVRAADSPADASAPLVRVRGRAVLGNVEVQRLRPVRPVGDGRDNGRGANDL